MPLPAAKPDPSPVTITEDVPNGLEVVLKDTDLPFARPREQAAFESGGKTDIAEDGIYNPGSEAVVLQIMQPKERPLVMKGAFRDGIYLGGGNVGHARNMRNALEKIRRNANPVRISWDDESRVGLLWETKFGEEGKSDITYELTFFITAGVDNGPRSTTGLPAPTTSIADIVANMKAEAIAARTEALARALSAQVTADLAAKFDTLAAGLDTLALAGNSIDSTIANTPRAALDSVHRVQSAAQSVQDAIENLQGAFEGTPPATAVPVLTASSQNGYDKMVFDNMVAIARWLKAVRTMRQLAWQKLRSTTQLYRVQPGDTLESIARMKLGSAARSGELGVSADQLVPGAYVRIPQ